MQDRGRVAALEVRGLSAGYGGPPVLEEVDFELEPGERIAVLGPNGGGKSTLFRAILGELAPLAGTVRRRGRAALVPQTERSRLDYPVSALDVALMGTLSRLPWWRPNGPRERSAAREALARVGLGDLANEQFGELSGGQRQRVLVARALVQDAPILLLDEPFVGVDIPSAELLERLLLELAGDGRAIMVTTHELEQSKRYDRVLCLNRRQVALGPPLETLTRGVLEATYGGSIVTLPEGMSAIVPPHHH
jgi:ABC-type Mn2+/Zn2+ transport system ATPase subunit